MKKYHYILKIGNKKDEKILSKRCKEVTFPLKIEIKNCIKKMTDYVKDSNNDKLAKKYHISAAVGLAANQIGYSLRILYIYSKLYKFDKILINPVITEISYETSYLKVGEGCLSVANTKLTGITPRYKWIKIKGYDFFEKKEIEYIAEDYEAIVIQHEIDHLNGILYIDKIISFDSIALKHLSKHYIEIE